MTALTTTRTSRPYARKLRSANLRERYTLPTDAQREQAAALPRVGVTTYSSSSSRLLVNKEN
jgi:hypothetical protein